MNLHPITHHGEDDRDFITFRQGHGRLVEIADIAVGSKRRSGIGTALISTMLVKVKQMWPDTAMVYAITRVSNTVAHEFYESLGFRLVGRLHYFYRDGGPDKYINAEHALVYGLEL